MQEKDVQVFKACNGCCFYVRSTLIKYFCVKSAFQAIVSNSACLCFFNVPYFLSKYSVVFLIDMFLIRKLVCHCAGVA